LQAEIVRDNVRRMAKQKTRGENELEISGAASALKYLEKSVARLQESLETATKELNEAIANQSANPPEKDGEDWDKIVARCRANRKEIQQELLGFSKLLLDYDKNVDTSRRDASESITRSDAEKFFFAFAIGMRGATEQLIIRQCQDAMEVKSPEEMYKIIAPLLRECYFSALKSATEESQMPAWVRTTIEGAL